LRYLSTGFSFTFPVLPAERGAGVSWCVAVPVVSPALRPLAAGGTMGIASGIASAVVLVSPAAPRLGR